jgi:hypothetical protein
LQSERLFRSDSKSYETVVAPLDDEAKTILTRFESPKDPPNYLIHDLAAKTTRPVTEFKDPQPQLRGVTSSIRNLSTEGRRQIISDVVSAAGL